MSKRSRDESDIDLIGEVTRQMSATTVDTVDLLFNIYKMRYRAKMTNNIKRLKEIKVTVNNLFTAMTEKQKLQARRIYLTDTYSERQGLQIFADEVCEQRCPHHKQEVRLPSTS